MVLPDPRVGESIGFHTYPDASYEGTLGDPERITWTSIKHLCSREVADRVLYVVHNIRDKRQRKSLSFNMSLYIQQAAELYEAAQYAKANTAPLFYYYSFLNLAKARCEINYPRFHKSNESYRHGISWRPNPSYLVNIESDTVNLTTRGVWHVLWEVLVGRPCAIPNPTTLKVRDLFCFCPEISIECERTFGRGTKLIDLIKPNVVFDSKIREVWINFSFLREDMRKQRLSRPKFFDLVSTSGNTYHQVKSDESEKWTFELDQPKRYKPKQALFDVINEDIRGLNPFVHLMFDELGYAIPVQTHLPILMPQIMVLYSIMFYLGSLVRYDPHSVASLQDSEYWILIDGFMNQSRIWFLELFEWEFYQTETILRSVR